MDMQISPHFTLSEFTRSQTATRAGLDNQPASPAVIANLRRTAALLERVRTLLGDRAIFVDSGYRSPQVNGMVGGTGKSAHCDGRAVDFICPAFGTPKNICAAILESGLVFDQLIFEGTWVHLAVSPARPDQSPVTPRGEVLTAVFGKHGATYLRGLA